MSLQDKYKTVFERIKNDITQEVSNSPQLPVLCVLGNTAQDISEVHFHLFEDSGPFYRGMQMRAYKIDADFFITVVEAPMIKRESKEGEPEPTAESIMAEIEKHGGVAQHPDMRQTIMIYFEDLQGNTHVEVAVIPQDRKLLKWEEMPGMVQSTEMNLLELRRNPEKAQVMEAVREKENSNPTLH